MTETSDQRRKRLDKQVRLEGIRQANAAAVSYSRKYIDGGPLGPQETRLYIQLAAIEKLRASVLEQLDEVLTNA